MIFVFSFWILLISLVVAGRPAQPGWQRACAVSIAFFLSLTFLQAMGMFSPRGVEGNATNFTPVLILLLGAGTLVFFVVVLISLRPPAKPSHVQTGTAVLSAVIGVYLMFVAVDHWWFFRGDDEKNGWTSPAALGVKEVTCDFALAREEGNAIAYRCPHLFIFGRAYAHPFVPWPSYTSGTSVELKSRLDELMREADRNAQSAGSGGRP
ncbi:hypothetical protein [Variovorax gossypii]|uniref:hypothetical protein n=1 Tax=uncultured Variovorax sp. TaxID=114708 RepID=UPI00261397D7|nr:hypothetical protein [uncultured Variovorax sp.]